MPHLLDHQHTLTTLLCIEKVQYTLWFEALCFLPSIVLFHTGAGMPQFPEEYFQNDANDLKR